MNSQGLILVFLVSILVTSGCINNESSLEDNLHNAGYEAPENFDISLLGVGTGLSESSDFNHAISESNSTSYLYQGYEDNRDRRGLKMHESFVNIIVEEYKLNESVLNNQSHLDDLKRALKERQHKERVLVFETVNQSQEQVQIGGEEFIKINQTYIQRVSEDPSEDLEDYRSENFSEGEIVNEIDQKLLITERNKFLYVFQYSAISDSVDRYGEFVQSVERVNLS